MNAVAQMHSPSAEPPDPAVLFAAVEVLPEAVAIAHSGRLLYANPAWVKMLDCDPVYLQGRPLAEFIPCCPSSGAPGAEFDRASDGECGATFSHTCSDGAQHDLQVFFRGFRAR